MNDREFEIWKAAYIVALRRFLDGKLSYKDGVYTRAAEAVQDYRNANAFFTRRPA